MNNVELEYIGKKSKIRMADLSDYIRDRLELFRRSLIFFFPQGEGKGIGEILELCEQHNYADNRVKIESSFAQQGISYTLLACLDLEHYNKMGDVLYSLDESVPSDLSTYGISGLWRSLGISCEDQRKHIISDLIENFILEFPHFFEESRESLRDINLAILCDNYENLISKDDPLYEFISEKLLLETEVDRERLGYRFTKSLPQYESHQYPITWVMSLSHKAYINNRCPSAIMSGAQELIEGIIKAHQINDPAFAALFKRRCLARVAMGFSDLMDVIDFNKEDIKPLTENDHQGFVSNSMHFARLSPLTDMSDVDRLEGAYNDKKLLERRGISVDTDLLMKIEKDKFGLFSSALAANADLNPDILKEAITHPLWLKIPNLCVNHSNRVQLPIGVQAALLHRQAEASHYKTYNTPRGPWNRRDQKLLLEALDERQGLTMKTIKSIQPDADILMRYKDKMPREAMRHTLSVDFGI